MEEVKETKEYMYDEIMKAVNSLDEDKKIILLSTLKINEILSLMNSPHDYEKYLETITNNISWWKIGYDALLNMKEFLENPQEEEVGFSEGYDKLSEDRKMDVALSMLNNPAFQKNCAKILSSDYKRIAKSDAMVGAFDKLFGWGKHIDWMIEKNIGCNHKYEVE